MNENNLRVLFFHGKTSDDHRFTVSGLIENDDLILGIAICSDNDHFSKAKGRLISTGRALSQRKSSINGKKIKDVYALNNSFHKDTGYNKNYFIGNELKVFIEEVANYNYFTRKELMEDFLLKK